MDYSASTLIEGYALGPFGTNCYIVHSPPDSECWIIDASYSPAPIIERVRALSLNVSKVILTRTDHPRGLLTQGNL